MNAGREMLRTLSHPFYALHALTFVSYLLVRSSASSHFSDLFRLYILRREIQTLLSLGVLLCIKCRRGVSYEAWSGHGLLYGKCGLLLVAYMLDRRLAAWYVVVFAGIFLLFQQPPSKELGNVIHMTPLQLENALPEGKCWLIEFCAVWSSRCGHASRVFANLSQRYSTEDLYFGSVDLGRFPKAGETYGISLGVHTGQLPTYALFEGGSEVSRFPVAVNFDGTWVAEPVSESSIAKHFELDRRLIVDFEKNCLKKTG